MNGLDKEEYLLQAINALRQMAAGNNSITTIKYLPAFSGNFVRYPENVHPKLVEALKTRVLNRFILTSSWPGKRFEKAGTWSWLLRLLQEKLSVIICQS
jgi:hypothetical protein